MKALISRPRRGLRPGRVLPGVGTLLLIVAFGCGDGGHGHDHDHDHDHDHGELSTEDEHHVHIAPNGGTLLELGDHFANLEFVVDPKVGELTAYVLDDHAENRLPIDQQDLRVQVALGGIEVSMALTGVPNPLNPGDNRFAEFRGQNDRLIDQKRFDVTVVSVTVKGQKFTNVTGQVDAQD